MHFFVYLVALGCVVNGATIGRPVDSYQNLPADSEQDINENLIQDEDAGDIDGLLPPRLDAKDYFSQQPDVSRESSYDMDSDGKTFRLKEEPQKEQALSPEDEQSVRDITLAFEQLMKDAIAGSDNRDPLQPIVIKADNTKPIGTAAVDGKVEAKESEQSPEATTLPSGESDTFTTDDSAAADVSSTEEESALVSFFHSLWSAVQESVNMATRMITSLGRRDDSAAADSTPVPETTTVGSSESSTASPAVGPIAAFEEPSAHHSLPAHEFDNRRDIDSLLYGRGIA